MKKTLYSLPHLQVLGFGDPTATSYDSLKFAAAMAGAGDGVLQRLRHHVSSSGFHLTEQIDRNSGESIGAHDLTWSYATTLKAMHARRVYKKAMMDAVVSA